MTETLTGLLSDRLAPWLTPQSDPYGAHQIIVNAKAAMGEQLFSLVWDQGDPDDPGYAPGWSSLFDVDVCPAQFLPFLAQLVGVQIPTGVTDPPTIRLMIRSEQGMQRGRPGMLVATAKRFLTGTQYVNLVERMSPTGPDPYWFLIVVKPSEISQGQSWSSLTEPWNASSGTWVGTDQTIALTNAINLVKPAGVRFTLIETSGHYWQQATSNWSSDTIPWNWADTATV